MVFRARGWMMTRQGGGSVSGVEFCPDLFPRDALAPLHRRPTFGDLAHVLGCERFVVEGCRGVYRHQRIWPNRRSQGILNQIADRLDGLLRQPVDKAVQLSSGHATYRTTAPQTPSKNS